MHIRDVLEVENIIKQAMNT